MRLFVFFLSLALVVPFAVAAEGPCDAGEAVEQFAAAADARDLAALDRLLHPEFRVVFTMAGSGEASTLSRESWLDMARQEKIGGVPRSLQLVSVEGDPGLRTVRATLDGASGHFASVYTVVPHAGRCRILQDATVFALPAGK